MTTSAMMKLPAAAAFLDIHPSTARRWAKNGTFPVPVRRINGVVRVSRAQLEAYVADLAEAGKAVAS